MGWDGIMGWDNGIMGWMGWRVKRWWQHGAMVAPASGNTGCWCPRSSSAASEWGSGLSCACCVFSHPTEAGDLYVWGWNESGQLALPSRALAAERAQAEETGTGGGCCRPAEGRLGWFLCGSEQGQHGPSLPATLVPPGRSWELRAGCCAGSPELTPCREQLPARDAAFISIQAFPALLDLPQDPELSAVSCGSRHTAAVTRGGELYTWGWGKYGQLGHGNNISSDQARRVEQLVAEGLRVEEVVCGPWTTYVRVREP
uniref:RCC1 domain containing 1 n=1 Tax=Ficedula albicollis TaxID=59894 RepID=U3K9D7_FICAL